MIQKLSPLDQPVLGCDVSAKQLYFFADDTGELIETANRLDAIKAVLSRFPGHCLGVEATGGYEALLMAQAAARDMRIYRLRGDRVSAHVAASGQRAKTDRLDARAIADFVRHHHERLKPFAPLETRQVQLLKQVSRREELVAMRAAEKNRLKAPDYDLCKGDIEAHIAFLTEQIGAHRADRGAGR